MIRPRDYQAEAANAVWNYFTTGGKGNPLICMPTGTGKSVVIACILYGMLMQYPRERFMVITHVQELIEQDFAKFLDVWPNAPAGIYSAGLNRWDTQHSVIFAGIDSVAKRANDFGRISIVFVDEAHLVSDKENTRYIKFFDELRKANPFVRIVGLTATPWRLGLGHLTEGGIFTDVCFDVTGKDAFNRFIQEGYLCPLVPKETKTYLDVEGVHTRGSEYISSELQAAVDNDEKTYAALSETLQLAGDRRHWLVYCAGLSHVERTCRMLNSMGVSAVAFHNKMGRVERKTALAAWKAGHYTAAVNNNILTTGIDFPALDLMVILRPTLSSVLWGQMLGRGTRPFFAPGYDLSTIEGRLAAIASSQKQNCLVLDFARNTKKLGPINEPKIPKKRGDGPPGDAPVKVCPMCSTYNSASAAHCIYCGYEFPKYGPKIDDTAGTDQLIAGLKTEEAVRDIRDFEINYVMYSQHNKVGKPPSMMVSYMCGIKRFTEFLAFEHPDGFSRAKVRRWWQERQPGTGDAVPERTAYALQLAQHLRTPTHVRVWMNAGKYPQILAFDYSGTSFGTKEAATNGVSVRVHASSGLDDTSDLAL